jgi:CheY-like chemotaxis protein/REP element-mobilizing transposase RayT
VGESVLIVTPSIGFGELIRQAIEESGGYEVVLATNGFEAVERAQAFPFSLTIIDGDIEDIGNVSVVDLWRDLQQLHPDLRLILVLAEDNLGVGDRAQVSPNGLLSKPFYMPNLLSTVRQVLEITGQEAQQTAISQTVSPQRGQPESEESLPWLQDVDRAAQYLTRLTLESAAQAALITRQGELWVYAGELPQQAASELARTAGDYWANNNGADLARFIRLDATGDEFMLYATGLWGDLVLSLIYDAKTPFSIIRSQSWQLAQALATNPNEYADQIDQTPGEVRVYSEESAYINVADFLRDEIELRNNSVMDNQIDELNQSESQPFDLDSSYPVVQNLSYACGLVPRLPGHLLTGEPGEQLLVWLPNLCLAYGWRLIESQLREECYQWVIKLPPDVLPLKMLEIVRAFTSQKLFDEFPRLREENPSGDFWAPGYLIVTSRKPLMDPIVESFVQKIRTWQGLR